MSRHDRDLFSQRLEATKQRLMANLPDHYELLSAIRAAGECEARLRAPPPPIAAGAARSTVPLPDWGQEAPAAG